jgi:hypothetical protein
MGSRIGTVGEQSWAGYDPLRNSKIRGSNFQGMRSLVRCVGPCAGYLASAISGSDGLELHRSQQFVR